MLMTVEDYSDAQASSACSALIIFEGHTCFKLRYLILRHTYSMNVLEYLAGSKIGSSSNNIGLIFNITFSALCITAAVRNCRFRILAAK